MTSWVVGASGKIGRALSNSLYLLGDHVIGIARGTRPPGVKHDWVVWDPALCDLPDAELPCPDTVYYLAGQTSASKAKRDVALDLMANLVALARVVGLASAGGELPHVISAGSVTESALDARGLAHRPPMIIPASFYETGKAAQRLYLAQFAREGLIDFTTLRLSNVYGGSQSSNADRGFLDQCVQRAVGGQSVSYFAGSSFSRDYIFVDDVVSAFVYASRGRTQTRNRTFDVGTGISTPITEAMGTLDEVVASLMGIRVTLTPQEPPRDLERVDSGNRTVDSSDFTRETGWDAHVGLREGLLRTVQNLIESQGCR